MELIYDRYGRMRARIFSSTNYSSLLLVLVFKILLMLSSQCGSDYFIIEPDTFKSEHKIIFKDIKPFPGRSQARNKLTYLIS